VLTFTYAARFLRISASAAIPVAISADVPGSGVGEPVTGVPVTVNRNCSPDVGVVKLDAGA